MGGLILRDVSPYEVVGKPQTCHRCGTVITLGVSHDVESCIERIKTLLSQVYDKDGNRIYQDDLLTHLRILEKVSEKLKSYEMESKK